MRQNTGNCLYANAGPISAFGDRLDPLPPPQRAGDCISRKVERRQVQCDQFSPRHKAGPHQQYSRAYPRYQFLRTSGVRYDLAERSPEFIAELAQHHTGGQLSVAPEHSKKDVLDRMKKPGIESYERFVEQFSCASEEAGKEQHLVPYFISGHPGSTLRDMVDLALYLKEHGIRPRQVQDFIPTPMSMATCMYYTGIDPFTRKPVYTAKDMHECRRPGL